MKTVTQEMFIQQIFETSHLCLADIRQVFEAAENVLLTSLSHATEEESIVVKPFKGLQIEADYIPERKLHTFAALECRPRIRAKPKITRYYNRKLSETAGL